MFLRGRQFEENGKWSTLTFNPLPSERRWSWSPGRSWPPRRRMACSWLYHESWCCVRSMRVRSLYNHDRYNISLEVVPRDCKLWDLPGLDHQHELLLQIDEQRSLQEWWLDWKTSLLLLLLLITGCVLVLLIGETLFKLVDWEKWEHDSIIPDCYNIKTNDRLGPTKYDDQDLNIQMIKTPKNLATLISRPTTDLVLQSPGFAPLPVRLVFVGWRSTPKDINDQDPQKS